MWAPLSPPRPFMGQTPPRGRQIITKSSQGTSGRKSIRLHSINRTYSAYEGDAGSSLLLQLSSFRRKPLSRVVIICNFSSMSSRVYIEATCPSRPLLLHELRQNKCCKSVINSCQSTYWYRYAWYSFRPSFLCFVAATVYSLVLETITVTFEHPVESSISTRIFVSTYYCHWRTVVHFATESKSRQVKS